MTTLASLKKKEENKGCDVNEFFDTIQSVYKSDKLIQNVSPFPDESEMYTLITQYYEGRKNMKRYGWLSLIYVGGSL